MSGGPFPRAKARAAAGGLRREGAQRPTDEGAGTGFKRAAASGKIQRRRARNVRSDLCSFPPDTRDRGYALGHAAQGEIGFPVVDDHNGRIDAEFAALPLRNLADAALDAARNLGADHADFRVERVRGQRIALSDGRLQSLSDGDDSGLAVRVIVDGTWGFASAVGLTPDGALG